MFGIANSNTRALPLSLALGALALTTVATLPAFAQTATPTATATTATATTAAATPASASKIAVANVTAAITESQEGKKEIEGLIKKFTPKQTELKTLSDEVDKMKTTLQSSEGKITPAEHTRQVKALEVKQKELQRRYEEAQGEFQQAEQEISARIFKKMSEVLDEYATAMGYDIVLDVSSQQQTPVLWNRKSSDITKELVTAYDTKYPAK